MKLRHIVVLLAVATLFTYVGYIAGRLVEVPGGTDDWKTFAQPVAVVGAALVALVVGFAGLFGVLESAKGAQRDNRLSREQSELDNRLSREQTERENRESREQTERENRESREQIERENRESREQTERSERLNRCWERFTWLAEQVTPPDSNRRPVITAPVALEVMESLVNDVLNLSDASLRDTLTHYQYALTQTRFQRNPA